MTGFSTPEEMVAGLKASASVCGIVRYGRRRAGESSPGGDLDLFVFVEDRGVDLESVHFVCGGTPVDLNIRTEDDLNREEPLTPIDVALLDGEILHDPSGRLKEAIAGARGRWSSGPVAPQRECDLHMTRFGHAHALYKARGRLASDPTAAAFLLCSNVLWLVQSYFRVRSLPYPGETGALAWLEREDGAVYGLLSRVLASSDPAERLSLSEDLTERVLAPIGGPWRDDELIAFGVDDDACNLKEKGLAAYRRLFGESFDEAG